MPDSREKRVDLILQQLEELPTLPSVAVRVLEVTGDNSSTADQVVELISSDPALTARILQMVNSAGAGVRGEIESVQRAVVLLGFETVRNAVLAVSVFETFSREKSTPSEFQREAFWKHSLAVGCCAELLAEALIAVGGSARPRIHPSEAFVCGLLHDLGKVALDATLPKSFSRVVEAADLLRGNIADVERNVIGLDHMVVGKRLGEKWSLPQVMRDCIWLHGQDPAALPSSVKNPVLVNLITLADEIVREQHLGYSGNYVFALARPNLLQATGLTPQHVQNAISQLVARIEPRAKSLGIDRATTAEIFQQALAQANKELGRVSTQLASKNRRLNVRTQFFEALSKFQTELRPDVSTQVVLQAIAQTAVGVLGVKVAAAFSLPPGQSYAETLLSDDQGLIFETSLIDLPLLSKDRPEHTRPHPVEPGHGPVMSAGPEMDWFVNLISPRLVGDKRFWICLEADGHCVGGIVWGANAGEAERLVPQAQELATIANGWALALRTAQIREEARATAEQLAETNRRLQNAQSEILRSRTMISVGEMAAGAAHEMNNPLAVISGRSQLLAQQLTDPKLKAAAHLVHEQAHRLSSIISELMDFAKPEAPIIERSEIAEVIDRALHEAKTANDPADRKIEVTLGDVPLVSADVRQVSAAITEVIENAIHATDAADGQIHIHAAFDPYSSRVVVTVTDNGCGMDEKTAKRAFDPFFSAKPAGRRRGLGLAKALRWIEASGGSIRLESRVGQGTRTVILLPAAPGTTGILPVSNEQKSQVI